MQIRTLQKDDLEKAAALFYDCFCEDHYYLEKFGDVETFQRQLRGPFKDCIAFCLETGLSVGVTDQGRLIAFALLFDYNAAKTTRREMFDKIFAGQNEEKLPYEEALHGAVSRLPGDTLYLLSIAVAPSLQRRGLASGMVDYILERGREYHLVSDVSNQASLPMYEKRGFRIKELDHEYFYVEHLRNSPLGEIDFSQGIKVAVPDPGLLDQYHISYHGEKKEQYLMGCRIEVDHGIPCFVEDDAAVSAAAVVRLESSALLEYQRLLNVSQFSEQVRGDMVYYVQLCGYSHRPLLNPALEEMLKNRRSEWSTIPDVYVSIPVQYLNLEKILSQEAGGMAKALLHDMDFMTHYEAGIPSNVDRVDDQANFKRRIERRYLGKLQVQIFQEGTVDEYANLGSAIGPPAMVDVYIALDKGSNCGVLTWYSLSAPFLVSHLFDNIIRNQLAVMDGEDSVNFFDYLKDQFEIVKRGTPKIFGIFPHDKDKLSESQLASLLAAETIYPEGENFGKIIDPDILSRVSDDTGMGQYDRVFVCAYSNVVLQLSEDLAGLLQDRMREEAITLFYIELILFEEAAIQIADREIINLCTSNNVEDPVQFLSKVDEIYDNYSRTIDFWDIKVNYPTSQRSIDMLRRSFGIRELLEEMERNQEHLQTVFGTKCEIIDRKDSNRMNTSLAIISGFAIFSAWNDSYDYMETWSDKLPLGVVQLLQWLFFALITITAGYAIVHLFGGQVVMMLRRQIQKVKMMGKGTFPKRGSSHGEDARRRS